uniref:Uncharacterized protein n=1 Tax=Setaria italica TaxID=4555 RepID=K3YXI9_SETIT
MTCMHTKTRDAQNVIIYICNSLFRTPNQLNLDRRTHGVNYPLPTLLSCISRFIEEKKTDR